MVIETRATLGDKFIKGLAADLYDVKSQADDAYALAMDSALGVEANQMTRIWREKKSSQARETIAGKSGTGYMTDTSEGEDYASDSRIATYETQFNFRKLTNSITITEEDIEDRIVDQRLDEARDLFFFFNMTMNRDAFNVLNKAFTAQASLPDILTYYGDGKPLASTLHPIKGTGGTQSNASATSLPLTEVNLETARTALRNQLDDRGLPSSYGSGRLALIVPVELEKQAVIITNGKLRPNTANNDINVYDGTVTVISSKWLNTANGGLDTQWALVDTMKSPLIFFTRRPLSIGAPYLTNSNKNVTTDVSARYQVGNDDFRGLYASKGDGSTYSL